MQYQKEASRLLPLRTFTRAVPVQVDTDFTNDDDVRAILIVHDTKPPFLDGRVSYTKQAQAVLPLRDPTSDMAVIARHGR